MKRFLHIQPLFIGTILCIVFDRGFGNKTLVNSTSSTPLTWSKNLEESTTQPVVFPKKNDAPTVSFSSIKEPPEVKINKKKKQPLKRSSPASLVLLQHQQPIPILISSAPTSISSKAPEKRASSSSHAVSSSILLKDDAVHSSDRFPIPVIYHPAPSHGPGKPQSHFPFSYKSSSSEIDHRENNYIRTGNEPKYYGQQVFSPQSAYNSPPLMMFNGPVGGYSQPYSHYYSAQGAASNSRPPYYSDNLCPAGKPYPVYIEKKIPVTVEKRVPYPVKVPYPVHHYHYDNVVHRNINAEDLEKQKEDNPPPPPRGSDDRERKRVKGIGGLFEGGDQAGFKGDDPEELEEERGKDTYDNDYYDTYDNGPKNYEAKRNVPKPSKGSRQPLHNYSRKRTPGKEEAVRKRDASDVLAVPGLNTVKLEVDKPANDTQTNTTIKIEAKNN